MGIDQEGYMHGLGLGKQPSQAALGSAWGNIALSPGGDGSASQKGHQERKACPLGQARALGPPNHSLLSGRGQGR